MNLFEHVKLPELQFDLKSETTETGRKYVTPDGKIYPSITTVLSSYNKKLLFEWRKKVGDEEANRIASKASRRGTKLHSICEKYLLNEMTDMKMQTIMPDLKELFYKIKPAIDTNVGKVYALEQALYSHELQVAGRVDMIAEWNGKLSVVDFKTSTKQKNEDNIQNYFMQCTAYALMFHERTGMWIDDIVVLISTEEGPAQVFERQIHDYRQPLMEYIHKYT